MPFAAAATVVSGYMNYKGSKDQADAIKAGANKSSDTQLQMFEQNRQDLAPWREAGIGALNQQLRLLGLDPLYDNGTASDFSLGQQQRAEYERWKSAEPEAVDGGNWIEREVSTKRRRNWMDSRPEFVDESGNIAAGNVTIDNDTGHVMGGSDPTSILRSTPGYQFAVDEGLKGLDRAASARGMLHSGAQQKALTKYAMSMADMNFGDYFNRLSALSGNAQTVSTGLANMGQQVAGNVGNNFMVGGMAAGNQAVNNANIGANAINNFADLYAMKNFNTGNTGTAGSRSSDYTGSAMQNWVARQ